MKRKISILYFGSTLKSSGPTSQLFNIICHLNPDVFQPQILTLSSEPKNTEIERFRAAGITVSTLGLSRLKGLFKARTELRQFLAENNFDIIHTQGVRADILISNFAKSANTVTTIRNYPYHDYKMKFGSLLGLPLAHAHLGALKKLNVIACSNYIHRKLATHNIKTHVIQNGVDTTQFKPAAPAQIKALRMTLGLNPDVKIFLTAGNLISRKSTDTLVKAFVQAELTGTQLVILGDGPERGTLERLANSSVYFAGNVSNVNAYLQCADAFCSASKSEGLPNTVLEAMASGLPCLLSDIPSHRELMGKNAYGYFDIEDAATLSKHMQNFVQTDPNDTARIAMIKFVEMNLSAHSMSRKYQDVYESLLS